MKKKSKQLLEFVNELHKFLVSDPLYRKRTSEKEEVFVQAELRPSMIYFLTEYFKKRGVKNPGNKAVKSLYWEGQEMKSRLEKPYVFGSRNYPDFFITCPYRIAIEYKKSPNGSTVKYGIGQCILHTLSNEFDFSYFLFHDESADKAISKSMKNFLEQDIRERLWREFNLMLQIE